MSDEMELAYPRPNGFATDEEIEALGMWLCKKHDCAAPGWISRINDDGFFEAFPCPVHQKDRYEQWLEWGPEGVTKHVKSSGRKRNADDEPVAKPRKKDWL